MTAGPRTTRTAATNDHAVAGALGVVLMLALAVTLFAQVQRVDVPRWGAAAEHEWDSGVQVALSALASAAGRGVGADSAVSASVPMGSDTPSVDVPLLGTLAPIAASGSIGFQPDCASFAADHATLGAASSTSDLAGAARGCLVFTGETAYAPAFGYQIELGGLLRVQGDRAAVLTGPSLELNRVGSSAYRVGLTVADLRGPAVTTSSDSTLLVGLTPGAAAGEPIIVPNAASATWMLDTQHPEAWKAWFGEAFLHAGFVPMRASPAPGESSADFTVVCAPVDCSLAASGLGQVVISIEGPRVDVDDLTLSLTHGAYDVALR